MPKCSVCEREFATDEALAQHMKDKHKIEERRQQGQAGNGGSKQRRKSLRKRNRRPIAIGLIVAAVVVGLGLYFAIAPAFAPDPIPCSTAETWIHVHPYLRITIEGTNVTIPANIGYLPAGSQTPTCLEEMHTHDSTGIIHIELGPSDKNANYTLGDFFRVWNATYSTVTINGTSHPVVFTNTDVFGFKTDATHKVVVLVDGKPVSDGVGIPLEQLDNLSGPLWDGTSNYPYGTGHTIVIEYVSS